jgi:DNA polymerase III alpha subunit (gram-positive type)
MLPYNQKYIIFDAETDGLNLVTVKPWQIAWSLAEGNKITKTYDEYLDWPDLEISELIAKLTGFNKNEYNKRKKPPEEVWEMLKKDLFDESRIVIGQNLIGYDCFVTASLQRYLGEKPDYSYMSRIYDTSPIGKAYKEGLQLPTSGDLLSWQYKIKHDRSLKAKSSQLYQLKNLGIDFDEKMLHNAQYDVSMTFKIFLELKKRMNF